MWIRNILTCAALQDFQYSIYFESANLEKKSFWSDMIK